MAQAMSPRHKTHPLNPKEAKMQYKTIVLELLRQRQELHYQLKQERKLLPTLNLYAKELKVRHQEWKERLSFENPGRDKSQVAAQALEFAVKELEERLPPVNQLPSEELSLDEAMAFVRRHTPPA
jgi:hypothetical protein